MQDIKKKLDSGADALRRLQQASKRLNDWDSLPKATKNKWRNYAVVVLVGCLGPVWNCPACGRDYGNDGEDLLEVQLRFLTYGTCCDECAE